MDKNYLCIQSNKRFSLFCPEHSPFSHSASAPNGLKRFYMVTLLPLRHLLHRLPDFRHLIDTILSGFPKDFDLLLLCPIFQADELIFLFCSPEAAAFSISRDILQKLYDQTGIHFIAGMSRPHRHWEFDQMISEAQDTTYSGNILGIVPTINVQPDSRQFLRPYNLSAREELLYSSALNGSKDLIEQAVSLMAHELFNSDYFCLRHLNRLEVLYHGMRINWMDKFRIQYPQSEHEWNPPKFYFSYGFDSHGIFHIQDFIDAIICDLTEVSLFYQRLSSQKDTELRFLEQIREYIRLYYDQPLSQQMIAERFYINSNYLGRLFRRTYHIGIIPYLNKIRIEKAKELLLSSSLSICQIATQTGFQDEKYFSRVFRQNCGLSPRQYRTQNKNSATR